MTLYGFPQFLVVDESMTPARNAVGAVYAWADTTFTTALSTYDLGGIPIASLSANDAGVVQPFQVADQLLVRFKSGAYVVEMLSGKGIVDTATAAQAAAELAQAAAEAAQAAAEAAGSAGGIAGAPTTWPAEFNPTAHTHTPAEITGATAVGRNVLTAVDAQAARAAIGAGTGNGTSSLVLGTTSTTAAPGNHSHTAANIPYVPVAGVTATNVQDAIAQAAASGGGGTGGSGTTVDVLYAGGAYPAQAASPPAGVKVRHFYGPVAYSGAAWSGVLDLYTVVSALS